MSGWRRHGSRRRLEGEARERERQALQINDNIVQGLARVKWALEAHQYEEARAAADRTLAQAQKMVTDLLMAQGGLDEELDVARLRRDAPAGAMPTPE